MKPTPLSHHLHYEDVAHIVTLFYREVLADPLLAPYFEGIDDWQTHERYISDFWWGLMGGRVEHPRVQAMERGHSGLSFGEEELGRWLALFEQTLRQNLPAEVAEQWSVLARQIGDRMTERGLLKQRPGR